MSYPVRRISLTLIVMVFVLPAILAACKGQTVSNSDNALAMAPMAGMPAEVKAAPTTVQQAYQFAVANPGVMKQIPCYCGFGKIGHTSSYSCYVQ